MARGCTKGRYVEHGTPISTPPMKAHHSDAHILSTPTASGRMHRSHRGSRYLYPITFNSIDIQASKSPGKMGAFDPK